MFILDLILLLISGFLAKHEYGTGRVLWAMFWSMLFGWDLHSLLLHL